VIYNYGVTTAFNNLSNIWALARSNGYVVHAMTVLPMGTNSPHYQPARSTQIDQLNLLIRDCTNNPVPPYDLIWETAGIVTEPWNTDQLYDGLHPTPAIKAAIGRYIGTNLARRLD